ncbi:hypothetical protein PGT21_000996 [Puccinia graminis f. sp. tritici]|uniref:Uncharacterized protein n=1 Tax=Puccinia graminis f. sp. tritici TaxID=56615 RepID=A0A5B0QRQ7_PUCGR|nr:hypothetical protein PGT21_000996 [Puccinia graminis f. sp. tritici]
MPPNTRSQKRQAAKIKNHTPGKVPRFMRRKISLPPNRQGAPTLINSFARTARPFRCTKGRLSGMKGALTPLNTRVENLKDHLLELKRKVQLSDWRNRREGFTGNFGSNVSKRHQEYMDDIKQLVEVVNAELDKRRILASVESWSPSI